MTFKILNGVSNDTISHIRTIWDNADIEDSRFYKNIRIDEYQDYVFIKSEHELYKFFEENIKVPFTLTFLVNQPFSGLGPIHTDGSRACAINFPVQVDFQNSNFLTAKSFDVECTIRPPVENEPINKDALRFEYEPEKYTFYNLRKPALLSTKVAHTAYNYSKDKRVLLSLTPKDVNYHDMIEQLPKKWL